MFHLYRQISVKMFGDTVWRRVTVSTIVSMSFAYNQTLARRSLKPCWISMILILTLILTRAVLLVRLFIGFTLYGCCLMGC